jgi:polyferredoxin
VSESLRSGVVEFVKYLRKHGETINKIADFFLAYAIYLAFVVFGALWALMSYAGVDVETAVTVINHDVYTLALFTAVFLMLVSGFTKLLELLAGKLKL